MSHFFLSIGEEGNEFYHFRVLDSLKFTCVSYAYTERDPAKLYSVKNLGLEATISFPKMNMCVNDLFISQFWKHS